MNEAYLKKIVRKALAEDIGQGDITTDNLIPDNAIIEAHLIYKSDGVVCGLPIAEAVFRALSRKIIFKPMVDEGSKVKSQKLVAVIKGPTRVILTAERVAINFLTHLSAIATRTRSLVDKISSYPSKIFDTRKTTPLLRQIERYAVRVGGGHNHRFDLSSMVMIKDNHRAMLNQKGLKESVDLIKNKTDKAVVLEVDTWEEFKEALTSKAEVILLDNMTPAQVRKAVLLRNKVKSSVLLEASGGITLHNVCAYAKTKVERISVGSLTSVKEGIDISLDFIV